ncbi:MAG: acrA 1 [Firmicutes bacterium]|nr:acrA 1 [Bacillota bacterium]
MKRKIVGISFILIVLALAGCGSQQAMQGPQAIEVKAMPVIVRDTPRTYEYVGQVQAKNEVQIYSRVSGNIVAAMVKGGDAVSQGQPLFQIDRSQYDAALLNTQAQLAQAQAVLSNAHLETNRYRTLASQQAISQQTLDNAMATEAQNAAAVEAYKAQVLQAADNVNNTLITAPFDGRIGVNVLRPGSYAGTGSTVLATISSVGPVYVQFSMSETEYLHLAQLGGGALPNSWGNNLKLLLSDGSEYPLIGHIEQLDRGLGTDTGSITIKAAFDNPNQLLLPGMFARIVAQGEIMQGAILVPQRAVQQLLGKTFVTVVADGDKAETRAVKMGPRVGNLWVVEEGLAANEVVVVDGYAKAQPGMQLKVNMIGLDDLTDQAKN